MRREPAGRAAARRSRVYDHVSGKAGWSASGLSIRGASADAPNIGVQLGETCRPVSPTEKACDARDRPQQVRWDRCVVNDERIVVGLLREKKLTSNPDANVEAATRNGPTTVRPDELAKKVAKRLRERRVFAVKVTTSDGRLAGVCSSDDAEHI